MILSSFPVETKKYRVDTSMGLGKSSLFFPREEGIVEVILDHDGSTRCFPLAKIDVLKETTPKPIGVNLGITYGAPDRAARLVALIVDEGAIAREQTDLQARLVWLANEQKSVKALLKANASVLAQAKRFVASLTGNKRLALCDSAIIAQIRASVFAKYCHKLQR